MKQLALLVGLLVSCLASATPIVITSSDGKELHTGLVHRLDEGLGVTHVTIADCTGLPADFDLADVGVVLPIRNQGSCGSCWAFSKTASLESSIMANGGGQVDLAEQELVSCDHNNGGCNGGSLNQSEYQVSHGQGLDADFPYQARNVRCKSIPVKAKGTEYVNVGQSGRRATTQEVQCALFKSHTIPWITASANNRWSSFPNSETPITRCGSGQTNHAIGVTGWKTISGKVYFRVRNSWGDSWGYKGTALMPLGCDNLGEEVAYIMTDIMPCVPPKVKLPVTVSINTGDEVELAVKQITGVSYSWTADGVQFATGSEVTISPTKDTIYKVMAKNTCGSAESSTQVKVVK